VFELRIVAPSDVTIFVFARRLNFMLPFLSFILAEKLDALLDLGVEHE
jgi:hypothetical protein